MRSLDLDSLRTYLACCDAASFAEAGSWVHKTQSTVSMQMKKLEETIGKSLFTKVGRRNALTPTGRELRDYAERMVRLNDEMLARFGEDMSEGRLVVGAPDDYVEVFLQRVLRRFMHAHPRVELVIDCRQSLDLYKDVQLGNVDIALLTLNGTVPSVDEVVVSEELDWVAPADRKLEFDRPLPLATWQVGCVWRNMTLEALDRAGIDMRHVFSGTNAAALMMTIASGFAVSALPRQYAKAGLRIVGPDAGLPPVGTIDIGLVRSDARPRRLADTFTDMLIGDIAGSRASPSAPTPLAA